MEKSTAEKALEGSLLRKLGEPSYFIMFIAFGFYWDSYSRLTAGIGLLNLTYTVGDAVPLGNIFILIASFSLLASILSPAIFWVCNYLLWEMWFLIPEGFRPGLSTSAWAKKFKAYALRSEVKLWSIKTNNSLAMALVKENENSEDEIQKSRPHPFLLALCMSTNYFLIQNGLLQTAEHALPVELKSYVLPSLLVFSAFLLYISFAAIKDDSGLIYLPGLNEYIEKKKQA